MKRNFGLTSAFNPIVWFRTALYGILIYFAYHSALVYLYAKWQVEDFSYCFMVPFIVLFLIWEKRQRLAALPSLPSWTGLVPLVAGVALFWLGELGGEFTLLFLSLWLVIVSLCWLHLGWRKLKTISFPLVFGLAAFVPPTALYSPLTFKLKLISSQIGVAVMQMYGMSAYREGNVIDLGFTQLQVVDACSGLRFVIPLFLMGILMAYYYRAAFWKKVLLVISTVPISIITNSLRIASVGILFQFWGPAVAEGFFHDFSGWFIFMAGMVILVAEMWIMNKLFRELRSRNEELKSRNEDRGARNEDIPQTSNLEPRTSNLDPHSSNLVSGFLWPLQSLVALGALLATVALAHTVDFREKTPLAKPFSDFPLQVGGWSGNRTAMEQKFLDELQLSDYALIDYRDHRGKEVSFYVGYNASQSKGKATHSPATCLPGSGWVFQESGTTLIPAPAGEDGAIRVSRAYMEKNGVRQLVYFWFPQRGRVLTNLYQIKVYNFCDALTMQRTDGALVRVITPVYANEEAKVTEARLQGFTRRIVPVLSSFLPR